MGVTLAQQKRPIYTRAGMGAPIAKAKTTQATPQLGDGVKSTGVTRTIASQTQKPQTSARDNALQLLSQQRDKEVLLRSGFGKAQPSFVAGTRNINAGDYSLHNVENAVGKYSSNPLEQGPRSQRRQMNQFIKMQEQQMAAYNNYQNQMLQAQKQQNVFGMLNGISEMAINITKEIKTSSDQNAAGTSQAIGNLQNAETSAQLQTGLSALEKEQKELKGKIDTANETVQTETTAKEAAESQLKGVTDSISSHKSNIQAQQGNIMKLEGQLALLKRQQDTAGTLGKMGINEQIVKAEAQLAEAKKSMQESKDALPGLEKQKTDLDNTINNATNAINTANNNLESYARQEDKNESAIGKYQKKLISATQSETKELQKMQKELADLQKEYSTADASKKGKIAEKYAKLAGEFNAVFNGTNETARQGFHVQQEQLQ